MYLHKHTIAIQASTLAGTNSFSTVLTGLVYCIRYIAGNLSTARLVQVSRESTVDSILKFNPSTASINYYPRNPIHGTTGNALASTQFIELFPLCRERLKISVNACSSAGSNQGEITAYISGD